MNDKALAYFVGALLCSKLLFLTCESTAVLISLDPIVPWSLQLLCDRRT